MIEFSQILIWMGAIETLAALLILAIDILPKQINEVKITRGRAGVDSTAVMLLVLVSIKVFLLAMALVIFACRRTICGMDFAIGFTPAINGTLILLLAFTWKYLYRNYKKDRE